MNSSLFYYNPRELDVRPDLGQTASMSKGFLKLGLWLLPFNFELF